LLQAQSGRPNDGAESATVEFVVVGHDHLRVRDVTAEDDVAALLSLNGESRLGKGSDTSSAREARQFHTVTNTASKCSSGTGSPSVSKAAT